jgi:hypothetical protein
LFLKYKIQNTVTSINKIQNTFVKIVFEMQNTLVHITIECAQYESIYYHKIERNYIYFFLKSIKCLDFECTSGLWT